MAKTTATGEASEALKYKTLVLKVLIHCQGCKNEVKKVLQNIEGVYMTTVDSQQHKVTVTGNVEAEILIKKLEKIGKQAQLCPENSVELQAQKPGNKKKKNKNQKESQSGDENDSTKNSNDQPVTQKLEKRPGPAGNEAPMEGAGTDNGGKKKKKSGSRTSNGSGNGGVGENVVLHKESPGAAAVAGVIDQPPMQTSYPYPPLLLYSGPEYALSYSTVNPSFISSSYSYSHDQYSSPHHYDHFPPPPSDPIFAVNDSDHDYYDDESGCSIM